MKKILRKMGIGMLALMILVAPTLLLAATTAGTDDLRRYSEGGFSLVQCDGVVSKPGEVKCDFSALIKQVQFLISWMFRIGVTLAVGLFAYAGILFMSTDPKNITKAREIFPNIVKGFVIMLLAWLIVRTILLWLAAPGFGTDLLK
ncbi:MAG: hypothetical protein HZA80_01800 [Candidatus Taylorbacteria bacterium]|nr:hypothetical protein [Candidatus Taylorbacteria bacterium]